VDSLALETESFDCAQNGLWGTRLTRKSAGESMIKLTIQGGMKESGWRTFYRVGGASVLLTILVVLAEIAIGFLPGVALATQRTVTVVDWFSLFQDNWFLGLRNLGLLNLIGAALLTPAFLAIYFALRRDAEPWAAMGAILFFVGMAVYLSTNRAFAMLSLSGQYARAITDAQRALLAGAGQAMLAESANRVGIFVIDSAGLVLSAAMLKSTVFGKGVAYTGMLGNALMIFVEIILAFAQAWIKAGLVIAIGGGISIITWYLLIGRRLFQLAASPMDANGPSGKT
jgi:hypothetical protein